MFKTANKKLHLPYTFQKLKTRRTDWMQPHGGAKSSLIKARDPAKALQKPNWRRIETFLLG